MLSVLVALLVSAPLTYVGVLMIADPSGVCGLIRSLAAGLENYQNRLRMLPAVEVKEAEPLSRSGRWFVRVIGSGLVAWVIAYVVAG